MIELIAIYCSNSGVCHNFKLRQYTEDSQCVEELVNLNTGDTRAYFEGKHVTFKCSRVLEDKQ